MVGLLDALEAPTAAIAGHDWGAPVAWHAALLRPDRFRAVIGLSVPFRPRGSRRPTSAMPQTDDALFYQLYFQAPGVAEAELSRDVRRSLRMLFRTPGAEVPQKVTMVPRDGGWLSRMPEPASLPEWLTQADLDFYAKEFERTGFSGGLNWYRNIDRNWELLAPWHHARVEVPALYVAGERDLVLAFPGVKELLANLSNFVPNLKRTVILPGCGHWTQQERPREVSAAMIEFLREATAEPGA
jgi:pimeloyl-ACP methyl ester carboxylesterase